MRGLYIIFLWLLGIVLVSIGWYVPGAGIIALLGAATLIFGAYLAYIQRGA
jgi:membrane-bound ClpP family serine protease